MRSSRGYLRLLNADPNGAIELQPNFLQEPSDLEVLVGSIDVCMDLAHAPPFASILDRPAAPDRRLSRREREDFVRTACTTFFHTCGTCAMGTSEHTVVDPRLRVHGIDGLRIVDASVIPVIPSCNTNAPVVMIAERAADFILGVDERAPAIEELSHEHQ
jgi:choline dehydrogenase